MSVIYEKVIVVNELNVGPQSGTGVTATRPSLSFGDGNTGFFEYADNTLGIALSGFTRWTIGPDIIQSETTNGGVIERLASTATNPAHTFRSDEDTGIGHAAADALSLISGGVEAVRLTESGGGVFQTNMARVGLTADAGSAQGNGIIISTYNIYDTVGVAGDCGTLPATFAIGTIVYIKNDAAANSMDVFPAAGDDAGAGANTAVVVAAGDFAVFVGTVANATWTKLMGGTA